VQCDPTKVLAAEACAKCHTQEVQNWQQTPHFTTFEQLVRRPEAQEICRKMGLPSVKRSDVCTKCHFTMQTAGDRTRPVSGISCESCHGAARDWLAVHNDYGGPTATRESETTEHREQRLQSALGLGMRNTQNLYAIASSCYDCHTVPNERLVNVGGHKAGTDDFELVAFSQGMMRHNFLRTGGTTNATSTQERLRVMYVVGLIADMEYSTRATAKATEKSAYGITVAQRAASTALKLLEIQKQINDADVQAALYAFAQAELKVNNDDRLNQIADEIKSAGMKFAQENDGSRLQAIDALLPDPTAYIWRPR
jgi:hypothetical protein